MSSTGTEEDIGMQSNKNIYASVSRVMFFILINLVEQILERNNTFEYLLYFCYCNRATLEGSCK